MQVSGSVEKDGSAVKGLKLGGKWDVELVADMPDGLKRRLWQKNPPAADPSRSAYICAIPCINSSAPFLIAANIDDGSCRLDAPHNGQVQSKASPVSTQHEETLPSNLLGKHDCQRGEMPVQVWNDVVGVDAERDKPQAGAAAAAHRHPHARRHPRPGAGRL